ncbi:BTAD domain-containing putative transcriptional regulator [Actinokineospora sp. 24-640]
MEVLLLGPVRAVGRDGVEVALGGSRLKAVLARLALDAGRVVPVGTLIDELWGAAPPGDAVNALHSLVSRLRKALRDGGVVESHAVGYRLVADVDIARFEQGVADGRAAVRAGRYGEAAAVLRAALGLWRGTPLGGVGDVGFATAAVVRLGELRTAAVEDRIEADLHLGGQVIGELRSAVAEQPLRERPAGLLMRALAVAGRQAEALSAYDRIRRDLAEQLGVEPSAELRELHLAVLRGELTPRRGTRLPAPLTSFVGRTSELAELRGLLARRRLVTLVGPGGAGKTRLATVLATEPGDTEGAGLSPGHAEGARAADTVPRVERTGGERAAVVWFVELAGVRAAEDVTAAVLTALGGRDAPLFEAVQVRTPVDRIVEVLSAQPGLLVLDNCEHLIEAAAHLADRLLARCPGLRVLATSREPLAITGEAVFSVGPLPADDALRLFVERAASASPGVRVDLGTAAEVCGRLDGLPLAVELAAARLRSMTLRQVAERLDDRFRLLTGGDRTALPRHRTLRAVVEWSWDLLEKPERLLAARLSVFPAGAVAESVTAVAADLPADDVVYVLASLVEKSLVTATEGRDGQVRYRMLETVRAYAGERLGEDAGRVRLAFARHVLDLLTEAEPRLRGPDQVPWLARLSAEQPNLLAAIRGAAAAGAAELACLIAARATWYWVLSGTHQENSPLAAEVLKLPGSGPPHAVATLRAYSAFGEFGGMPSPEVVRALVAELAETDAMAHHPVMAMLEPMLAAYSGDSALADQRLTRAETHCDPWARAVAQLGRAYLADNDGNHSAAAHHGARALADFRAIGDRWGQAMAVMHVAERHSLQGDHPAALATHEEAVRLVAELGAQDELAGTLARLGVERARGGDLTGAERDLTEALRLATDRGGRELAALAHFWLSTVARRRGDPDTAAAHLATGRSLLAEVPRVSPQWTAIHLCAEADLATDRGDQAAALTHLRQALMAMAEVPDMPVTAAIADSTAYAMAATGDHRAAARMAGVGTAIRGTPDLGSPDLADLLSKVDKAIGQEARTAAQEAGAALPRTAALAELTTAVQEI